MTGNRPKLTYFSGSKAKAEMERRGWSAARLAFEIYKRSGLETTPSTLGGVFNAGAEATEDGYRLFSQPNATLLLAVLSALELTPEKVVAKL